MKWSSDCYTPRFPRGETSFYLSKVNKMSKRNRIWVSLLREETDERRGRVVFSILSLTLDSCLLDTDYGSPWTIFPTKPLPNCIQQTLVMPPLLPYFLLLVGIALFVQPASSFPAFRSFLGWEKFSSAEIWLLFSLFFWDLTGMFLCRFRNRSSAYFLWLI